MGSLPEFIEDVGRNNYVAIITRESGTKVLTEHGNGKKLTFDEYTGADNQLWKYDRGRPTIISKNGISPRGYKIIKKMLRKQPKSGISGSTGSSHSIVIANKGSLGELNVFYNNNGTLEESSIHSKDWPGNKTSNNTFLPYDNILKCCLLNSKSVGNQDLIPDRCPIDYTPEGGTSKCSTYMTDYCLIIGQINLIKEIHVNTILICTIQILLRFKRPLKILYQII
jgi:hypothetical protein